MEGYLNLVNDFKSYFNVQNKTFTLDEVTKTYSCYYCNRCGELVHSVDLKGEGCAYRNERNHLLSHLRNIHGISQFEVALNE